MAPAPARARGRSLSLVRKGRATNYEWLLSVKRGAWGLYYLVRYSVYIYTRTRAYSNTAAALPQKWHGVLSAVPIANCNSSCDTCDRSCL